LKQFLLLVFALFFVMQAPPARSQELAAVPLLQLEDCRIRAGVGYPGIKARCGTLQRPLDPANPDGESIDLFVAVVPALSLEPALDPLVPIAGGPGQASSEFYAGFAGAFEDIRRERDIVLLDQRGTGQSAAMDCDVDEDELTGPFSAEETIAATVECLDSLPYDPRFFTTSVAVEDLEALRTALGYQRFNLYGISYGSRVAQHFLRRYPDATRSVILDGVAAPQIALGPGIAIEAQRAMEAIFARCAESEDCAARFPRIEQEFAGLRARLAVEPVTLDIANPVTGQREETEFSDDELAGALRLLSYSPSTVALIPLLVHEAAAGNYAPLAAQFMMVAESLSDSMSIGMHNAVVCTEDEPFFAGEEINREMLEATYIGPLQLDSLEAICSVWPKGPLDDEFKMPVRSDVPVLLLSGEADPITPPRYAELAAVDLGNALHLVGRKQGHGMAPRGCMPEIIGDFVASADISSLETGCLDRLFAMPFFLGFSGPAP
jgi:pimeloyl-ACP methyl ester carboxylesterase